MNLRGLNDEIDTSLRNQRYTGQNRCIPCTVVNVLLAAVVSTAVGMLVGRGPLLGGAAAIVVFVVSLGVIYLRGYFVPGTPTLTKRYLPDSVLAAFDKADAPPIGSIDPESELRTVGIVEEDTERNDLVLTLEFERAWLEAIADRTATTDDLRRELGRVLNLDSRGLELESRSKSFVAMYDGSVVAKWESRAACRADLAAAAILPRFVPDWDRYMISQQMGLLGALRIFLEECPSCGGEVSITKEVVESCCRSHEVVATSCDACAVRLLESPIATEELELA